MIIAWSSERLNIGDVYEGLRDVQGVLHFHQPFKVLKRATFDEFRKQYKEMTGRDLKAPDNPIHKRLDYYWIGLD
jgi:hypothetical protein